MAITQRQVAAAARMSRRVCRPYGYGHQVLLWPDGTCTEAVSDNDVVALLGRDGKRTYPLVRLRSPTTRADVRQMVEAAEWEAAMDAEESDDLPCPGCGAADEAACHC